jgi:hypothetical protein
MQAEATKRSALVPDLRNPPSGWFAGRPRRHRRMPNLSGNQDSLRLCVRGSMGKLTQGSGEVLPSPKFGMQIKAAAGAIKVAAGSCVRVVLTLRSASGRS